MHFEPVLRPFAPSRGNTAAQEVVKHLQRYIPNYAKGGKALFQEVAGQTDQAISFAHSLSRQNQKMDSDNPSTEMHLLVEYLKKLKRT